MNTQRVIKREHTVTFYGQHGAQMFSVDHFERMSERVELVGVGALTRLPTCSQPYFVGNTGWEGTP